MGTPEQVIGPERDELVFHPTTWMLGQMPPRPVNSSVMPTPVGGAIIETVTMRNSLIGILVTMIGVVVALCAWLFPFRPIGQSPFDKANGAFTTPPIEHGREQSSQQNSEQARLEVVVQKQRELPAVIDDPDGYTNVRLGPGIQYEIISRVVNDEVFYVIYQKGNWWQVRTREGKYGYMHRSRIKIR